VAKGKSTSAGKPQSATRSNRSPLSPSAPKSSPDKPPVLSSIEIGHVAGEIWGLLSTNGDQTLAAIKKSVDAPADVVLAGIGWLAREDKLDFATSGRNVKISLR
jgi:hypothetical protein